MGMPRMTRPDLGTSQEPGSAMRRSLPTPSASSPSPHLTKAPSSPRIGLVSKPTNNTLSVAAHHKGHNKTTNLFPHTTNTSSSSPQSPTCSSPVTPLPTSPLPSPTSTSSSPSPTTATSVSASPPSNLTTSTSTSTTSTSTSTTSVTHISTTSKPNTTSNSSASHSQTNTSGTSTKSVGTKTGSKVVPSATASRRRESAGAGTAPPSSSFSASKPKPSRVQPTPSSPRITRLTSLPVLPQLNSPPSVFATLPATPPPISLAPSPAPTIVQSRSRPTMPHSPRSTLHLPQHSGRAPSPGASPSITRHRSESSTNKIVPQVPSTGVISGAVLTTMTTITARKRATYTGPSLPLSALALVSPQPSPPSSRSSSSSSSSLSSASPKSLPSPKHDPPFMQLESFLRRRAEQLQPNTTTQHSVSINSVLAGQSPPSQSTSHPNTQTNTLAAPSLAQVLAHRLSNHAIPAPTPSVPSQPASFSILTEPPSPPCSPCILQFPTSQQQTPTTQQQSHPTQQQSPATLQVGSAMQFLRVSRNSATANSGEKRKSLLALLSRGGTKHPHASWRNMLPAEDAREPANDYDFFTNVVSRLPSLKSYYDVEESTILNKFTFTMDIGSGGYSVVRRATDKVTGQEVAVKVVSMQIYQQHVARLEAEAAVLGTLCHPAIVKFFGIVRTPENICFVMELLEGGELYDEIVLHRSGYPEPQACAIITTILEALEHLHSRGVVHRDIKPENFLYSSRDLNSQSRCLKLIDFGFATFQDPTKKLRGSSCGTPDYIAPELLVEKPHDQAVDLWSAGVVLYILLSGSPPFAAEDDEKLFDLIAFGNYSFPAHQWQQVSDDAKDLVGKLMCVDASQRLTAMQALAHPWIQRVNKSQQCSFS